MVTGLALADEHEAAAVVTLAPGGYTAIVSGADAGTGLALVEVYDLTPDTDSSLANISTRGDVGVGDDVMIGGFIIGSDTPTEVIVRAIGPSLTKSGVIGATAQQYPLTSQEAEIIATSIAPTDDRESAIVATLQPGAYTAIVRGQNSTTGIALVEIYNLDFAAATSNPSQSR